MEEGGRKEGSGNVAYEGIQHCGRGGMGVIYSSSAHIKLVDTSYKGS
jgi:hypothetical protein